MAATPVNGTLSRSKGNRGTSLPPMVMVGSVPIYCGCIESAVAVVVSLLEAREDGRAVACVSATGAHGIVHAHFHEDFRAILDSFHINLPDGMPVVWTGRLKGARQIVRCYGPAFFAAVMKQTAGGRDSFFLCGGKPGVAEELAEVCKNKFGNDGCVGCYSPPFRELSDAEWQDLSSRINEVRPDIIWIGLSTPKQEVFAFKLAPLLKTGIIITVGAAFDFHTGRLRPTPPIFQRMGLEWLFRLMMEPRRLLKRYMVVVPVFLYLASLDVVATYLRRLALHRS